MWGRIGTGWAATRKGMVPPAPLNPPHRAGYLNLADIYGASYQPPITPPKRTPEGWADYLENMSRHEPHR